MDGMLEVHHMSEINRDISTEVAIIFVDSYYDEIKFLSKDKEKLVKIFKNSFVKEAFYIALMDNEVAGILACSNNKMRAIHLEREVILQHLGFMKGSIIYFILENEFHTPISYDDTTAYIESVATHISARGKGVATRLLEYVTERLPYKEYRLTVRDNNKTAISIYKKFGFKEFDRMGSGFFEKKYFKYKIYMKMLQTDEDLDVINNPLEQQITQLITLDNEGQQENKLSNGLFEEPQ